MLTDEDLATIQYLRNSPKDALKREAADLIERLAAQLERLQREKFFQ